MKKTNGILLLLALIALGSCQKEIDWGTGDTPTTTRQLIRIKSKSGTTDSAQVDYSYDGSGRLILENTIGVTGGVSTDNQFFIRRNAAGVITSTVQKSPALVMAGIDSIETKIYYNSTTSRYTAAVVAIGIPGFSVLDSAVFSYDGSGRISKDDHYTVVTGLPIPLPPLLSLRNTYTYSADGKNLLGQTTEAAIPPATTLSPVSLQTQTMDTKQNPLVLLQEAIVIARTGWFSANNPLQSSLANTVDPTQDFALDIRYVYNSSNLPDSAYSTRTPGGTVTASAYFYR